MGIFDPAKQSARVTSTLYYSGNATLPGALSSGYWQIRATTMRTYFLSLAADGVIDMGIFLHHTLKTATVGVQLTAKLIAAVDLTEAGIPTIKNGQTLWADTLPADARFIFLSERGTSQPGTTTQKIVEVPELRQPLHKFILELTPLTVPDEGDLYMRLVRRY